MHFVHKMQKNAMLQSTHTLAAVRSQTTVRRLPGALPVSAIVFTVCTRYSEYAAIVGTRGLHGMIFPGPARPAGRYFGPAEEPQGIYAPCPVGCRHHRSPVFMQCSQQVEKSLASRESEYSINQSIKIYFSSNNRKITM